MKYLFYFDQEVEAWLPVPEKTENLMPIDQVDEVEEILFRVIEMKEKEFEALFKCLDCGEIFWNHIKTDEQQN